MKPIVSHLWFDTQAKEAAYFYCSLFPNSQVDAVTVIKDTPSGDCDFVNFTLAGLPFSAISAGPYFTFNPSISLTVTYNDETKIRALWEQLLNGGEVLMPLQEYDFSTCFGWLTDRYGLNWQLMVHSAESGQTIVPSLLFSGAHNGLAREAMEYYVSVFADSAVAAVFPYALGEAESHHARVRYAQFRLKGTNFVAMDNAMEADYTFNEAFSFVVPCQDQDEIDYFWSKLSHVPEAEQCGWCKDRFGISWQVVPHDLDEAMFRGSEGEKARVTEAFLQMKKFDLEKLKAARLGL